MKMKLLAVAVLASLSLLSTACGEGKAAKTEAPVADTQASSAPATSAPEKQNAVQLTKDSSEEQKVAYAIGASFGGFFAQINQEQSKYMGDIDKSLVIQGFIDSLDGKSVLTDDEIRTALEGLDAKVRAGLEKEQAEVNKKNLEEGKAYLEKNAKTEGVKVTESGLQYQIIQEGTGASPSLTDTVSVIYKGTTIDGKVFDEQTSPVEFPLNGIIPGWTEGLQLIKEGGKIHLVIPSDLAYGEAGAGDVIPPNSVLIFDVELVKVNPSEDGTK